MSSTPEIQAQVANATEERGYRDGWSDEQFLARQVVKLQEELGELSFPILRMPNNLEMDIVELASLAREAFDNSDWSEVYFDYDEEKNGFEIIRDEAADCLVVLFNIAATIEKLTGTRFDLVEEALQKATSDIPRGVRK